MSDQETEGSGSRNIWERHPRGSRKEYLDQTFPKQRFTQIPQSCTIPCYHREFVTNHSIGRSSSDPQINTIVDLTLANAHNLQVVFDRQQKLGSEFQDFTSKVLTSLEEIKEAQVFLRQEIQKVAETIVSEAQKPKDAETRVLGIAENLETQVQEVRDLLQQVKDIIPT